MNAHKQGNSAGPSGLKLTFRRRSFGTAVLLLVLTAALAGCGSGGGGHEGHGGQGAGQGAIDTLNPIMTKVKLPAEPVKQGTEAAVEVTVTQDGKPVDDADEVLFEVWKEGAPDDQHEKIKGTHGKDGLYTLKKKFDEPGTYLIISHVTARTMHTMPQVKLQVE
ncbi:FixH family protein [Paenibacillus chitinolyticus]